MFTDMMIVLLAPGGIRAELHGPVAAKLSATGDWEHLHSILPSVGRSHRSDVVAVGIGDVPVLYPAQLVYVILPEESITLKPLMLAERCVAVLYVTLMISRVAGISLMGRADVRIAAGLM